MKEEKTVFKSISYLIPTMIIFSNNFSQFIYPRSEDNDHFVLLFSGYSVYNILSPGLCGIKYTERKKKYLSKLFHNSYNDGVRDFN